MTRIRERIITYRGKKINVRFSVDRCTHVAECLRGAPKVFDTFRRPWVLPDAENPDKVADVVLRCPTGSLHYERLDGGEQETIPDANIITLKPDGPMYFAGDIEVVSPEGEVLLRDTRISFCRCGSTDHKPFCDGMHMINDYRDDGKVDHEGDVEEEQPKGKLRVTLQTDGPILLDGPFVIKQANGRIGFSGSKAALCRCGASENPPFCDGTHKEIGYTAD